MKSHNDTMTKMTKMTKKTPRKVMSINSSGDFENDMRKCNLASQEVNIYIHYIHAHNLCHNVI